MKHYPRDCASCLDSLWVIVPKPWPVLCPACQQLGAIAFGLGSFAAGVVAWWLR